MATGRPRLLRLVPRGQLRMALRLQSKIRPLPDESPNVRTGTQALGEVLQNGHRRKQSLKPRRTRIERIPKFPPPHPRVKSPHRVFAPSRENPFCFDGARGAPALPIRTIRVIRGEKTRPQTRSWLVMNRVVEIISRAHALPTTRS